MAKWHFYGRVKPEGEAEELALSARDVKALVALREQGAFGRLLDTHALKRITSQDFGQNKLGKLVAYGIVDRPKAGLAYRNTDKLGSRSIPHYPTNLADRLLAKRGIISKGTRDWAENSRRLAPWHLPHKIGEGTVWSHFRAACDARGWTLEDHGHVTLAAMGKEKLIPDLTLVVEDQVLFVEVHLEEEHTRSDASQQSLQRKVLKYLEYLRAKKYQKQFGVRRARVLIVTKPERLKGAVEVLKDVNGWFLATDFKQLTDPFETEWTNTQGEIVRL